MIDYNNKYRKKSLLITVLVQIILVTSLFFIIAWRETIPPIPEYGIELEFGLQSTENETFPELNPSQPDQTESTVNDELESEVQDNQTNQNQLEEPLEKTVESEDIETLDENSQDVRNKETVLQEEIPKKATAEKNIENQSNELEKVKTDLETKNLQSENKGDPEGQLDARALYENKGDSESASLQMTGWRLSEPPKPDDKSQESGKIVFEIKVDEDGYIVGIKTVSSTVTPSVERVYRHSLEVLVLEKTADYKSAPFSTGTITFIIKAN